MYTCTLTLAVASARFRGGAAVVNLHVDLDENTREDLCHCQMSCLPWWVSVRKVETRGKG